jgi:hypothetical protein
MFFDTTVVKVNQNNTKTEEKKITAHLFHSKDNYG